MAVNLTSSIGVCQPDKPIDGTRGAFTLELTTSALCDLDCTYCFEGAKTNKARLEQLDLLIQRIYEILNFDWFKEKYNGMSISFWGGEPTLNPHYIIKIMNEFQHRDDVKFHMYSNGFNRKNMATIIENVDTSKFEIQISYDGKAINDRFRLTKNGKTTSEMVIENFEWLADQGVTVFFKSTVPSSAIHLLYDVWQDFAEKYDRYKEKYGDKVRVSFAPTVDYTMTPSEDAKAEKVKVFRDQMLKIAKCEIEFFKKNGHHLCTWFAAGDSKSNCSAGLNMMSVDVDGKTYACHGALYSDGKEQMRSSSIFDENFLNSIKTFHDSFEKPVNTVSDVCKECVATMCMICPVSTYELSKEESFFDRWGDRQINGLCSFYQTFGEIDRTVQRYLSQIPKEK